MFIDFTSPAVIIPAGIITIGGIIFIVAMVTAIKRDNAASRATPSTPATVETITASIEVPEIPVKEDS